MLILVDDMGYGDPGCYNSDSKIPTPHIDSLARDGMRFTDAHAPGPLCHMSRYGLMTGRYPFRTNVGRWRKQPLIEKGQMTIASLLRSQGYRTAMVGKWHLGFKEDGYDRPLPGGPVDCGFDSYFGIRASTDIPPYFYIRGNKAVAPPTEHIAANNSKGWSPIQGAFWRAGGIAPGLELKNVLPRFTDEAIDIIKSHAAAGENLSENRRGLAHFAESAEQNVPVPLPSEGSRISSNSPKRQPLFLYLAYPAPHTPWLPSKEFVGKSGAGMYGDFTVMVDAMIGRILRSLDDAGLSDNTLVIFTSDNGPVWYEADVRRFDHDSSGGLRGMKADAWECGHRMPFVARWPGRVKPGSTTQQIICFTDLLATFAAIVGQPLPDKAGPDSFDFSRVLLGTQPKDQPVRDTLVLNSGNNTMVVRQGDWKLIAGLGSGGFSDPKRVKLVSGGPQGQLYDLSSDLAEENNLYQKHPEIVQRLTSKLSRIKNNGHSRVLGQHGTE